MAPTLASGAVLPESAASRYAEGDLIASKYRLEQVLGEGGMGAVWLARNQVLDVDVAIKLIRRDRATDEASERLLQEARTTARIGHPSIVRIFDFGETDQGDPFIVMELLPGESLRRVLARKGRLPIASAIQTLLPVVAALRAAHAKGVIHRDVKPENIFITRDERGAVLPKVVDFGIAKLRREAVDRRFTQDGILLGSPDYMSPEQARGRKDIDERTDVWSLSVVLYEAITGRVPFEGSSYNALLRSIVEDTPRPVTELCDADDDLWAILERGLAKDRTKRWPGMQEMGKAIAQWALDRSLSTDVTGGSLSLDWLTPGARRPFSEPPPLLVPGMTWPPGAEGAALAPPPLPGAFRSEATPEGLAATPDAGDDAAEPPAGPPPGPAADAPPLPSAATSPGSAASRPSGRVGLVLALVALAAGGLLGLRARLTPKDPAAPLPPTVAVTVPALTPAPATASAPASASAPATASASASAPAPASASASAAEPAATAEPAAPSLDACVVAQFAPDAFPSLSRPDFAWICAETDPRRGASGLKRRVVQAAGDRVTEAMREWAQLQWYEMAGFAVTRARCCPTTAPLSLPTAIGRCDPLDRTLEDLGAAAAGRGDVDAALARYRAAVHCAVSSGAADDYPYRTRPPGGAEAALRRTIDRAPRPASPP